MQRARVVDWLFATDAVRVSAPEAPFWYTSGLIGPYYVNTHFLLGGENTANSLLALIDETRDEPLLCVPKVIGFLRQQEAADQIFRQVIDAAVQAALQLMPIDEIDFISGGERRDWIFSIPVAERLGKPHLGIFKDLQVVLSDGSVHQKCLSLPDAKVLHISDLVTEASSYLRAWLPALENLGARMAATLTIVDRRQEGAANLANRGIPFMSLAAIEPQLFAQAAASGYLTNEQQAMVAAYLADPFGSMQSFLRQHPEFLKAALEAGERTAERARRLLSEDLYRL